MRQSSILTIPDPSEINNIKSAIQDFNDLLDYFLKDKILNNPETKHHSLYIKDNQFTQDSLAHFAHLSNLKTDDQLLRHEHNIVLNITKFISLFKHTNQLKDLPVSINLDKWIIYFSLDCLNNVVESIFCHQDTFMYLNSKMYFSDTYCKNIKELLNDFTLYFGQCMNHYLDESFTAEDILTRQFFDNEKVNQYFKLKDNLFVDFTKAYINVL